MKKYIWNIQEDIGESFSELFHKGIPFSLDIGETFSQDTIPQKTVEQIFTDIAELKGDVEKLKKGEQQQIIPVQFLESDKLVLKQSIFVNLSYYANNEIYIVDCPELEIYGEGRDEHGAISDFKDALEEFYFDLKKDEDKLGVELENKWKILKYIIEEK